MADERKKFVYSLHGMVLAAIGALALLVAWLLWHALTRHAGDPRPGLIVLILTAGFVVAGVVLEQIFVRWLLSAVLAPAGKAAGVAMRVSQGDLREVKIRADGRTDGLTMAVGRMVGQLRTLVDAIHASANDAAAMAQEIAASTEQMSASTEEVASTTGDLTERANQQAQLVRAAADDAGKILVIAKQLAGGAEQAAERNSALARVARSHRERLDASTAELQRLADEVERGAKEAEALAAASEEIQKFVTQTKAIAKQTHMLALNASIEAARAGEEGRGFSVVAEEVRKLAAQAAQSATSTSDTVQSIVLRVHQARERLLRLGSGGMAARDAAHAAADGLATVAAEAEENDQWTRRISTSAEEVRGLIEGIAGRMREVSAGTEDYAAAAEEIAAAAQQLNASTEEISSSAGQLAGAAEKLTQAVGGFRLS